MNVQGSKPASDGIDVNNIAYRHKQRNPNPRYRTKLCRNYPLGSCRYGDYCSYLHIRPSPSHTTQFAPSIQTIAHTMFSLSHAGPPSHTPAYHTSDTPARYLNGTGTRMDQGTPNGHGYDTRTQRAPRSRRGAQGSCAGSGLGAVNGNGTSVENWRLDVSVNDALPPAPPGTPVAAVLDLKEVPVSSLSISTVPKLGAEEGLGELGRRSWVGDGEAPNADAHRHLQIQTNAREREQQRVYVPLGARPVRHRNLFFKTKPCRFYTEPAGCIKGHRCNFIHESPAEGRWSSGLVIPASAEVVSERGLESGPESSVQGDMSACTSPTTEEHPHSVGSHSAQLKRNFYPVTWRVVGGGVMMSGKREVCENFMAGQCPDGGDCRYAHPDMNEEECVSSCVEPPPVYSPISPVLSPVLYAYPVIYPSLSPSQPFVFPATPVPVPASPAPSNSNVHAASRTLKSGATHVARPGNIEPIVTAQAGGLPYPYSPHRIVDGSTLIERNQLCEPTDLQDTVTHDTGVTVYEGGYLSAAARSVVRPVSTPPMRSDAGVARLFAAEMP